MKKSTFAFCAILVLALLTWLSCSKKEQEKGSTAAAKPPVPAASAPAASVPAAGPEGEEGQPAGAEEESSQLLTDDEEKMPWQFQPSNDRNRILIDPNDKTKNMSYWRDAKEGDWVRFINHAGVIGRFEVIRRQGNIVTFEVRLFDNTGKEINMDNRGKIVPLPEDAKPETQEVDIEKDDALERQILKTNPAIRVREVVDWKVFKSDKVIQCERRFAEGLEKTNETVYSRDVRAGGMVFVRTNNHTLILLLDWGDKDNPPKWNLWTDDELKKWKFRWNRFWDQEFVENEDPQEPEPPEKAEDPPSQAIVTLMDEVAAIFARKVAPPIEKGLDLTETARELENLLPLLKQLEELHSKERFGYGTQQAQALTNAALNLKDSLSGADPAAAKDSLARARSAYENLRLATDAEAKW